MKRTLTAIALLAGATSGYSQGTLMFNLYSASIKQAIYNYQPFGFTTYSFTYAGIADYEEVGSTPANIETPKGTTIYTGSGLSGTGYDMQLLAGPVGITSIGGTSSANGANNVGLTAVGGISHFRTGLETLGMQATPMLVTLPTESYFAPGVQLSLAVAAWNNEGGTLNTLADVIAADERNPGCVQFGISPVIQTTYADGIGTATFPSVMPTTFESFALGFAPDYATPEPSTFAFSVMGLSALLTGRRRILASGC